MGTGGEVVVGICLVVAALGTIVPVLPGTFLALAAVLVWAVMTGGGMGWIVGAVAVAIVGISMVLKFLVPGKHMSRHGVPGRSMAVGGVLGLVGFFVIPVVGLLVGFVAGVYASEWQRLGTAEAAWPSTKAAMKATGLSILIELGAVLVMSAVWFGAATAT